MCVRCVGSDQDKHRGRVGRLQPRLLQTAVSDARHWVSIAFQWNGTSHRGWHAWRVVTTHPPPHAVACAVREHGDERPCGVASDLHPSAGGANGEGNRRKGWCPGGALTVGGGCATNRSELVQDMSAVLEKLLVISSIGMVGAIGTSIIQTSGARLAIEWRDELVKYMHKEYFQGKTMYYMNALDRRVDNTDQRMTQDADNFVTTAGQLLFGSFSSSVSLTYVLTSLGFALYKTAGAVNGESVMYLSVYVGFLRIRDVLV